MNLTIGSGDVTALLSGTHTKGYGDLMRKFVAEDKPIYNAFASPINALRTGAILEKNYVRTLGDDYYSQVKVTCKEMDVLTVSLDFAKMYKGECIDFDELKTIFFTDYIEMILPLKDKSIEEYTKCFKSKFKSNYNQIQSQLYASGLDSANLVFLCVESYDDSENESRELQANDFIKFRIYRDDEVIKKVNNRLQIFQHIKNHFGKDSE